MEGLGAGEDKGTHGHPEPRRVSLSRSLMRLDLIDEFRLDLPYVAGEGTRLSGDVPKSYWLDLISSTEFSNGTVGLQYRRHR